MRHTAEGGQWGQPNANQRWWLYLVMACWAARHGIACRRLTTAGALGRAVVNDCSEPRGETERLMNAFMSCSTVPDSTTSRHEQALPISVIPWRRGRDEGGGSDVILLRDESVWPVCQDVGRSRDAALASLAKMNFCSFTPAPSTLRSSRPRFGYNVDPSEKGSRRRV